MRVIVHGGAGGSPDEPTSRRAVLDRAAETGAAAASPPDAVERAIGVLEASPRFNAGVGGAVQSDGAVRTDAGIMTDEREAGAACSMPGVERAIAVARVVMTETPHVLVSGEHARALAEDFGIDVDVDLRSDDAEAQWSERAPPRGSPRDQLPWIERHYGGDPDDPTDHDTVGAVATDGDRIVAGTSTGGRWYALAGRVGDVPQVGAGFFASPAGGASATGAGEAIAKTAVSRRAVTHLEDGADPETAARRAIDEFEETTGASAGVIVADREGAVGSAYNSEAMQTSAADE